MCCSIAFAGAMSFAEAGGLHREYVSSASFGLPKLVYILARRFRIFGLFGSRSSAFFASSRASAKRFAEMYAAARLERYVAERGSASIAVQDI